MLVHLLTEILPRWCEVEYQVEVLANFLKECVVKAVADTCIILDDVTHIFQES